MTFLKLCLIAAFYATILITPFNAFAQSGKRHTVQRPACTTRALDQGSGSVRMCGAYK